MILEALTALRQRVKLVADSAGHLIKADKPIVKQDGSIANLAASAIFDGAVIDLGENHPTCQVVVRKIGVASAAEVLQLLCSNDGVTDWAASAAANGSNTLSNNNTSNANMVCTSRPHARYVRVRFSNGAAVQSATAILVTTVHWGV